MSAMLQAAETIACPDDSSQYASISPARSIDDKHRLDIAEVGRSPR